MREDELKRIAGKAKVPLGTVEKDYVITLILNEISELDYFKELAFIFNRNLFIKSLEEKKEGWKRDLVIFIPEVPPFDQVKAEILDSLRQ